MELTSEPELTEMRKRKRALSSAIEKERSRKWILRLWSRFIKARDLYRCVCCASTEKIQAHHVIRRTVYPEAAFETGNGVTLCYECHGRVHAEVNGRADPSLPLGAEQGDNQDEWAFLFGMLQDDALQRGLDEDEFYYLGDHVLEFSVRYQGYEEFHEMVMRGEMSRIRFAHGIWRPMPEAWYTELASDLCYELLSSAHEMK